jgi:hypothetical protein
MEAEHVLEEHFREIAGIHVVSAWDQVTPLRQAVDYYPYGVVAL